MAQGVDNAASDALGRERLETGAARRIVAIHRLDQADRAVTEQIVLVEDLRQHDRQASHHVAHQWGKLENQMLALRAGRRRLPPAIRGHTGCGHGPSPPSKWRMANALSAL